MALPLIFQKTLEKIGVKPKTTQPPPPPPPKTTQPPPPTTTQSSAPPPPPPQPTSQPTTQALPPIFQKGLEQIGVESKTTQTSTLPESTKESIANVAKQQEAGQFSGETQMPVESKTQPPTQPTTTQQPPPQPTTQPSVQKITTFNTLTAQLPFSPFLQNLSSRMANAPTYAYEPVKDVAGNIIPMSDVISYAGNAPRSVAPQQKIDWAIKEMSAPVDYTKSVEKTEAYSIWGRKPDQSSYQTEKEKLEGQLDTGLSTLSALMTFRKDYPEFESQYKTYESSYKSNIKEISMSSPETEWGIDVDKSGTIEQDEIFERDIALKKMEEQSPERVTFDVDGEQKSYSDIYATAKEGYASADDDINALRASLVDISQLQTTLSAYKQAGYGLKVTDKGYSFPTLTAKQLHEKVYGTGLGTGQSTSRFVAKQIMSLGISAGINYAMGRWGDYEEEEYARLMDLSKKPKEDFLGYTGRFWTSPEAIESTWLPLATMGAGYAVKGLSAGGQVIGSSVLATKVSGFGTTTAGRLTSTGIKTTMYTVGAIGVASAGINVYQTATTDPEHLGTVVGHLVSGSILGYAGWRTGSRAFSKNVPKPKIVDGKPVVDVKLAVEDVQLANTQGQGNLGLIKAYGEAFVHGEKPGTGIKYYYTLKASGRGGIPIGDTVSISKSSGLFYNKAGTKIQAAFEAYGKATKPIDMVTTETALVKTPTGGVALTGTRTVTTGLSTDSFIAGVYGKEGGGLIAHRTLSDVYQGKGLTLTRASGTKTMTLDVGTGKLPIDMFAKVDVTSRVSLGSFESNIVRGKYFELGVSKFIKGFKEGNISVKTAAPSGLENFLTDTSGYLRLVSEHMPTKESMRGSFISTMSSEAVTATMGVSTAVSPTLIAGLIPSMGAVSSIAMGGIPQIQIASMQDTKTLPMAPIQEMKITKLIPTTEVEVSKISGMAFPKVVTSEGIEQFTIAVPKVETITTSKQDLITEPKSEVITTQKQGLISIPKTAVTSISKMAVISIPKTDLITLQKTETVLQKSKVFAPPIVIPHIPYVPFVPFGFPGMGGRGSDWGFGGQYGKKKKYRKSKTVDPFAEARGALEKSMEIDFGVK